MNLCGSGVPYNSRRTDRYEQKQIVGQESGGRMNELFYQYKAHPR